MDTYTLVVVTIAQIIGLVSMFYVGHRVGWWKGYWHSLRERQKELYK